MSSHSLSHADIFLSKYNQRERERAQLPVRSHDQKEREAAEEEKKKNIAPNLNS